MPLRTIVLLAGWLALGGGPALPAPPGGAARQAPWVEAWLADYDAGRTAVVAVRLRDVTDLETLRKDLDRLSSKWVGARGVSPDARRRTLAAFALEAVAARLDAGDPAGELLEWGCRQVRRVTTPGAFEHAWHLAAFALFSGLVDPDGIDAHVTHMRHQFPSEPRLVFERAVAAELRAAPFFEGGRANASEVATHYETAARHYRDARRHDAVRDEATLRLARVDLMLGRADETLAALDGLEDRTTDSDLLYLAHLFRGQALERLDRPAEAADAYRAALAVRPGAQSASVALAAVEFRQGHRGLAASRVADLLHRTGPAADDPWWTYWPADFRLADDLIARMRKARQ